MNHEQKAQQSILWHSRGKGLRGARKGNRPFQEAEHLLLVLAAMLGAVGRHATDRISGVLADCLHQYYESTQMSGLTFGNSGSSGVGPGQLHLYKSSQVRLPGLILIAPSKWIVSYGEKVRFCLFVLSFAVQSPSFLVSLCTPSPPRHGDILKGRRYLSCWLKPARDSPPG